MGEQRHPELVVQHNGLEEEGDAGWDVRWEVYLQLILENNSARSTLSGRNNYFINTTDCNLSNSGSVH